MIYLQLTTNPQEASAWVLHLESLTLIKLIRPGDGTTLLSAFDAVPPCEAAFMEIASSLEAMPCLEGSASNLVLHSTAVRDWDPPSVIVFQNPEFPGFLILHTTGPLFAFGMDARLDFIGPIWRNPPRPLTRESYLSTAYSAALLELVFENIDESFVDCWFKKPDQIAWPA